MLYNPYKQDCPSARTEETSRFSVMLFPESCVIVTISATRTPDMYYKSSTKAIFYSGKNKQTALSHYGDG